MNDARSPGMETELKLLLPDTASIDRLLTQLGPELPARLQRNVYYDGPKREWSAAGLAIRLREEEGEHQLTVKTRGEIEGDFIARGEFERRIEPETAWRFAPGGPMLVAAVADLLDDHDVALPEQLYAVDLEVAGSMENLRRRALLPTSAAAEELIVELDTTTYPNGQVLCEAELEVPDVATSAEAVGILRAACARAGLDWKPSTVSKRENLERILRGESL